MILIEFNRQFNVVFISGYYSSQYSTVHHENTSFMSCSCNLISTDLSSSIAGPWLFSKVCILVCSQWLPIV